MDTVADHFHLVQLANQTVTEDRRRVTVTERGRHGRKGNRERELRDRLTPQHFPRARRTR